MVENKTLKENKVLFEETKQKRKMHLHDAWWELNSSFEEDNYDLADRKELTDLMARIEALRVKQDTKEG